MTQEDFINVYMDGLFVGSFPVRERKKYRKYFKLRGVKMKNSKGQILNATTLLREEEDEAI